MSVSVLNTTASLSGKTLAKLEDSQTFTGAKTFDLGASAPFIVMPGSAMVANLDADKLDGFEATAFPRLAAANAFTSTNTFTGNLGLAALAKQYFDGVAMSGDTYIQESAANVLSLFSGGVEAKLTSGVLTLGVVGVHTITGGSNATQTLSVINTTSGTAGKVEHLQTAGTAVGRLSTFSQGFTPSGLSQLSSTLLEAQGAGGLSLAASDASGAVRFYAGGTTERMRIGTGGNLAIAATAKLFLDGVDGAGDTYLEESSANTIRVFVGTTRAIQIDTVTGVQFFTTGPIITSGGYAMTTWTTTVTAANAHVADGAVVKLSTSLRAHKHDIIGITSADAARTVLALQPVLYRSRIDKDQRQWAGFIAEDTEAANPQLAMYAPSGALQGVAYDRVPAYLVRLAQDHEARIAALEARQ